MNSLPEMSAPHLLPKFSRLGASCAAALFCSIAGLPSAPAAVLKKAEVTAVVNDVKLVDPQRAERGAKVSDVVQGEVGVKTGIQSRAELLFQDKTLTRLGANTIFSFNEGTRDLELERGTMLLQCPKGVGGAKIRTAAVTAAITGTTILLEYSPVTLPKRPPGYVPKVAELTPEECVMELQQPRRSYSWAERRALAKKAKETQPGGYVKVMVLEGTLRLYLNTRVGESVLLTAGQMVILGPRSPSIPPVVEFDIALLARTSLLVDNRNWKGRATEMSMGLVAQQIAVQERLKRTGALVETNLVIPGTGTEVWTIAELNQNIEVRQAELQAQLQQLPNLPGGSGGNGPLGGGLLANVLAGGISDFGPLSTITSSNPYFIGSTTQIVTDPSITTNGVTDYGKVYRNVALDGTFSDYVFGSTTGFDVRVGVNDPNTPPGGTGVFRFSNFVLTGGPAVNTVGGPTALALISEGTITSGLPGGAINVDALDRLYLGTVNGLINLGPELSFSSSRTTLPNAEPIVFGLYARGGASDLTLDADVSFADRKLTLAAEHDVIVGGNLTTAPTFLPSIWGKKESDLEILAGNVFQLAATGQIHAQSLYLQATDVAASGPAFIDTKRAIFNLQNSATFTQSGGQVLVNTLPLDLANLQSLAIFSGTAIDVPGNINAPSVGLILQSLFPQNITAAINGQITVNSFSLHVANVNVGVNGLIVSPSVLIEYTQTLPPAVLAQSGPNIVFGGLPVREAGLTNLRMVAPTIQVPGNFSAPAVNLEMTGLVIANADLTAQSINFLAPSVAPLASTINGNLSVTGTLGLAQGSLTVGGTVSAQQIQSTNSGQFPTTTASLTATTVHAPGGLLFQGPNGVLNPDGSYSTPKAGRSLTLGVSTAVFDTIGPAPRIGFANFNGGDAQAASGMAGGDGGSLVVNSAGDITLNAAISATTGVNSTATTWGGVGGAVQLNSTNGAIVVNSSVEVSSDDVPNRRVSRQGGNITVQTGKTTGPGIHITNTAELRSLLNATAPGPGGTIQVISAGADVTVDGRIKAVRGTVDVRNNGATGQILLNSTAQLAADVIKVGALGANGQLTIAAGSQINAVNTLKLYGGSGALGKVLFTGAGTVNITGNPIHIAAKTVEISNNTQVQNNGPTSVHTDTALFGVGAGNGNFQNPVTQGPLSGAPGF